MGLKVLDSDENKFMEHIFEEVWTDLNDFERKMLLKLSLNHAMWFLLMADIFKDQAHGKQHKNSLAQSQMWFSLA